MSDTNQQPTELQLQQARMRGEFVKSRELISAIVWLGALAVTGTMSFGMWTTMTEFADQNWSEVSVDMADRSAVWHMVEHFGQTVGQVLFPFLAIVSLVAIVVHATQTEFRLTPDRIKPDVSRLSPHQYVQKVFSLGNLVKVLVGLCKLVILIAVVAWVLWHELPDFMAASGQPLNVGFADLMEHLFQLSLALAVATLLIGFCDYGLQRWIHHRRLFMSEQEIREEQRSTEPAPEIGARRRLLEHRVRNQPRADSASPRTDAG